MKVELKRGFETAFEIMKEIEREREQIVKTEGKRVEKGIFK